MDSDQQNFQMMADAFLRELQMERIEVVISDLPYFTQQPTVSVYYQEPNLYISPKWRDRTNLVRMMDEIKGVLAKAKSSQQSKVSDSQPEMTDQSESTEVRFLGELNQILLIVRTVPGKKILNVNVPSGFTPVWDLQNETVSILNNSEVIKDRGNQNVQKGMRICPNCATNNSAWIDYCDECGTLLPLEINSAGNTLKCNNCGVENEIGWNFCWKCGKKMPVVDNKLPKGRGGYGNRY